MGKNRMVYILCLMALIGGLLMGCTKESSLTNNSDNLPEYENATLTLVKATLMTTATKDLQSGLL